MDVSSRQKGQRQVQRYAQPDQSPHQLLNKEVEGIPAGLQIATSVASTVTDIPWRCQ